LGNVTKLYSHEAGSYTETLRHALLACGNIEGNNNKFYSIEIQHDPSSGNYRIFTNYGRTANSNIYEERGPYSLGQAEHEFENIVKKKLKGKNIKEEDGTTRREKYEMIEVISPTVGSSNVRHVTTRDVATHISASEIIKEKDRFTVGVQRLLDQFAQENIHKITSSTSLTFTANGFETALGPVTQSHISKARGALNTIKPFLVEGYANPASNAVREANNLYLSLIPHPFGRKITADDWIITDAKLMEEYDLLDQLEASVQMGLTTNTNASKQFANFETDIEPISAKDKAYKALVDAVNGSKRHGHLNRWNVKNIYIVKINGERTRFETKEKKYGNIQEFFHGSQNANLLSILIGGLIIPPMNAGHVTGRMFGNGIYGADSSTKSLNYSVGGWSGRGNKFSNSFLFRVKFAMGKTYEIGHSTQRPPTGYDSISALSKLGSLMNNEFIVYNLDQCTITHMIELEER
jgi:poly [ADP-ribose] polymerase 2/3/4